MVKALGLRSNVRMHAWVRTPFLVEWDPCGSFLLFFLDFSGLFFFMDHRHSECYLSPGLPYSFLMANLYQFTYTHTCVNVHVHMYIHVCYYDNSSNLFWMEEKISSYMYVKNV